MVYLRNVLGRHEVLVARYYMKRGAYLAAANRAKTVISQYQQTAAISDALVILREAYDKLGLHDLAHDAEVALNNL